MLSEPRPDAPDLSLAVAVVNGPNGNAYRGKVGCKYVLCTMDGHPERCYGWHCMTCDGPANAQGDCARCR